MLATPSMVRFKAGADAEEEEGGGAAERSAIGDGPKPTIVMFFKGWPALGAPVARAGETG
jgi:hypothetical protein